MQANYIEKIKTLCEAHPEIGLCYLFGSHARGDANEMSDYDVAVYFAPETPRDRMGELRLSLIGGFMNVFETDDIDVTVLNFVEQPEFKYAIIAEGELVFEREPYKVIVEPKIMNEYFDFKMSLEKNYYPARS